MQKAPSKEKRKESAKGKDKVCEATRFCKCTIVHCSTDYNV